MPRLLAVAVLLLTVPAANAQAAPLPARPDDPQAVAPLTQMARAYQGMKSYSVTETTARPQNLGTPYRLMLTCARPDRTRYCASNSRYPKRCLRPTPPKALTALDEAIRDPGVCGTSFF